jgi:glycosyltransferase involved in cell wall biosynthesis
MTGGGAIRTASLVEYLALRYALDVIVFREPGAPDPRNAFPPGLAHAVDVIDLPYHSKRFLARATRNGVRLARGCPPLVDRFGGFAEPLGSILRGRDYDLALIEHFWCAAYGEQIAASARRVVLDLHNVESVFYRTLADAKNWPASFVLNRFAGACSRLERQSLASFSTVLVTSHEDAAILGRALPGRNAHVYPNALPLAPTPCVAERNAIVFSGNLEYQPNVLAVRYFRREIWPALRARFPGLVWRITGKNSAGIAKYVAGDGRIEVTGPVRDAVAELAAARVIVVPVLAGSGTRFKILEAWAAGRAVVSTTLGAAGLGGVDGEHLILGDSPHAFVDAVSRLLESPDERTRLGRAGRQLFESQFTWPNAWKGLEDIGM